MKTIFTFLLVVLQLDSFAQGFTWARSFGLPEYWDDAFGMAIDGEANTYTIGNFAEAGLVFIHKRDVDGNFVWQKELVCYDTVTYKQFRATGICTDNKGYIYLTGFYTGTVDFDPGPDTSTLTKTAGYNTFILKLDNKGKFIWVKDIGGTGYTQAQAIVCVHDAVSVAGFFDGTVDFDPGIATYNITGGSQMGRDAFVLQLDSDGQLKWAINLASDTSIEARRMVADSTGCLYILGSFEGTADFDPGSGVHNLSGTDFILKIDSAGAFRWARTKSYGASLAIDKYANIYFSESGSNLQKLDSTGNLLWSKQIAVSPWYMSVDDANNIFATSVFDTVIFDTDTGKYKLTTHGALDILIFKLDSVGKFIWAKGIGGDGQDWGNAILPDAQGNAYVSGIFTGSVDFDTDIGTYYLNTKFSSPDIFVMKIAYNNVGIEDIPAKTGIIISPNPVKTKLQVTSPSPVNNLRITDLQGRIVKTVEHYDTSVDVSDLPPGLYILQLQVGEQLYTHKFIKE